MPNPYETLGVAKNASADEIKKAYRKLARHYHPDRNPGDKAAEERFKEVQSAYDLLADPDKRKQYDTFGDAANGGPPGDLHVVTRVAPSPIYERRDADLVVNVPLTYPEAALGATVEVPTPEGAVSLKVPAGSEDGKLLRIRGRGAPRLNGQGRGDVLARIRISVPKKLTKAEREKLEELRKVERRNPREGLVS